MIIDICDKSTLAKQIIELADYKVVHLDIDKVGHRVLLLPEVKKELINLFGESIVKENILGRKKIGEIVKRLVKEL